MYLVIEYYCFDMAGACSRYIITTAWSFLLVCLSIYTMCRTYLIRERVSYEFAPLITSAFSALLNTV